jgi:phosphate transport system permease protein
MMRDKKTNSKFPWLDRVRLALRHGDTPWQMITVAASLLIIGLMIAIGWQLWQSSSLARHQFGIKFFLPTSQINWDPVNGNFQAWPFIYGTLLTSLTAILLAVPISLGVAIFMAELCPARLRLPLNWLVELLAAIPSVIYGLWGLFIFLPVVVTPVGQYLGATLGQVPVLNLFFSGSIPEGGASRLGAAFILTFMIIPTITAVTRDVLLAVPDAQREASMALGSTQWESISQVLLPYGLSGILGAVILGLGRALGETMAVTMVIGNSIEGTLSLLRPGYTMASIIANEFAEAVTPLHAQSLLEVALILFFMTLILNMIARFLVWRVTQRIPTEVRL